MYMDDIKLFAKNEKELETQIQRVRINSQDVAVEFVLEKCIVWIMRSGKGHVTKPRKIRMFGEKEYWKRTPSNKRRWKKRLKGYLRRTRKLREAKLLSRNLIKRINSRVVPYVRSSGLFFKLTRGELQQMSQWTRKMITMHKALHPRDDVDRLYVIRKEEGWRLASTEDSVDVSIQRHEDYIKTYRGRQITASRNNTDHTSINRTKYSESKNRKKTTVWYFKRQTSKISHEKTWRWPRKGNLREKLNLFW